MERNNLIKKGVVVAVILLFVSVSVIPSTGTNVVEKTSTVSFAGNTLYVGGNGTGNYSKLQDAIDDANDGDTVFVYDDLSPYYENVMVNKTINLTGENRNTTIIYGDGGRYVVLLDAGYINISGFTIRNSGNNWSDTGIEIISDYNTITGNNITNNENGIFTWISNNNIISDNDITSNNNMGIWLISSNNNIINSNNISNNEENGIHLSWCSYNNSINGNKIKKNYDGIYLEESSNNTISGNNISNNRVLGLHLYGSDNNTITNNFIISNYEEGIYLYGSNSNNITRNTISENEDGIELESSNSNTIKENNISSNYDYGIEAISFSSNYGINNIITGNNIISNIHGIYLKFSNSNTILKNNFINNQQHAFFIDCKNIWKQNYWGRARIFPKIIFGRIGIYSLIPWVNIDWHPAQEPYIIET